MKQRGLTTILFFGVVAFIFSAKPSVTAAEWLRLSERAYHRVWNATLRLEQGLKDNRGIYASVAESVDATKSEAAFYLSGTNQKPDYVEAYLKKRENAPSRFEIDSLVNGHYMAAIKRDEYDSDFTEIRNFLLRLKGNDIPPDLPETVHSVDRLFLDLSFLLLEQVEARYYFKRFLEVSGNEYEREFQDALKGAESHKMRMFVESVKRRNFKLASEMWNSIGTITPGCSDDKKLFYKSALLFHRLKQDMSAALEIEKRIASEKCVAEQVAMVSASFTNEPVDRKRYQRVAAILDNFLQSFLLTSTQKSIILIHQAKIFHNLGEYGDSLQLYSRLSNESEEWSKWLIIRNLAGLLIDRGDYERAIDILRSSSLTIDDRLGNFQGMILKGNALYLLGKFQDAKELYTEAFQIAKSNPQVVSLSTKAALSLGNVEYARGNLEQASEQYSIASEAEAVPSMQLLALTNLANIAFSQDKFPKAAQLNEEALDKAKNDYLKALIHGNLLELYSKLKNAKLAESHYSKAQALCDKFGFPEIQWRIWKYYGDLHQNDFEKAESYYLKSIRAVEALRVSTVEPLNKLNFFSERLAPYEAYVDLLAADGADAARLEKALNMTEMARARALLDQMAFKDQDFKAMTGFNDWRKLNRKEVSLQNMLLQDAFRRNISAHKKINVEAARVSAYRPPAEFVFPEVRSNLKLPRNVAFVSIFLTDNNLYFFVIENTKLKLFKQGVGRKALFPLIVRFLQGLETPGYKSTSLSAILVTPWAKFVTQENIVVIPGDIVNYVPFAALSEGNKYLLERFVISYAPSLNFASQRIKKGMPATAKLVIFGNPELSKEFQAREHLTMFEDDQDESKELGRLFDGSDVKYRAEATETSVKSQKLNGKIVHFSTHGVLREADPLSSFIALAESKEDDGRLHASEIMNMDLQNVPLVTMAACQSHVGGFANDKIKKLKDANRIVSRGDEILGLSRAVLIAGASSVAATLWEIPTTATKALMIAFYSNMKAGQPRAVALRNAQLAHLRSTEYGAPDFWAGFILVGGR